jgi:hypothetical protein
MKSLKEIFSRKKENIESHLPILVDYIEKAHKHKITDTQIMQSFLDKGYPKEMILRAFELNLQEEKMAKKKEEPEDEDFEEDEDDEDEEDEEVEEKPKKKTKVKQEAKKPTVQDILMNHEQRLQNLEAKFFRLQNA